MKYGELELTPQKDTVNITFRKNQKVVHYPGTNVTDIIDLGKSATIITCTLIAFSDFEKNSIIALLNGDQELSLEYRDMLFKKVRTGESNKPKSPVNGLWYIDAEFIALDPKQYSLT